MLARTQQIAMLWQLERIQCIILFDSLKHIIKVNQKSFNKKNFKSVGMTLAKVKEQDGMTLAKVKEQDGMTLAKVKEQDGMTVAKVRHAQVSHAPY